MKQGSEKYKEWIKDLKIGDPVILKGKRRHESEKGKIRKVEKIADDGDFVVECYGPSGTTELARSFKPNGVHWMKGPGYYLHPPKCSVCPQKAAKRGFFTGGFTPPFAILSGASLLESVKELEVRLADIGKLKIKQPSMLPPEGLDLKVGEWVELWSGDVIQITAVKTDSYHFPIWTEHTTLTRDGFNFKRKGPHKQNVRRLIPREQAPPYMEWLESVCNGRPFNCKAIKPDGKPVDGFINTVSNAGFLYIHGIAGVYKHSVDFKTGLTYNEQFRIVPTDW